MLEVRVVTGKGVAWQHSDRAGAKEVEVKTVTACSRDAPNQTLDTLLVIHLQIA